MEERVNELEADIETLLKLWVSIGEVNASTWVSVRKSVSEIGTRVRRLGVKEKMKLTPYAKADVVDRFSPKAESLCKNIESFSNRYELMPFEKVNVEIFLLDKEAVEGALIKRIDWSRNRLYATFNLEERKNGTDSKVEIALDKTSRRDVRRRKE